MSIDSQELNITGGVKVSGHVKSNFGVNFGVGTDSPSDAVHVAHASPALAVQQQATSGGTVTSYGKVHADSGTLHIQSGVDATSDSKGDIVLGSVGSATKHVVVKGATSNVGIGTDDPAYGLDVVPSARFTGNVVASNLSANAITLAELSLEVTQGLDNVVNVDNTTGNTIAMSNVTDSTSTSSGALTVAGGIGVGGNVHCSNLHASNITMNLFSFTGAQTFEQVVNTGRVLNSNVLIISNATPSTSASTGALTLTAGGLGVEGNVHVGTTGEVVVSNTAPATSSSTGAIQVAGGVGVGGNVHVGTNLEVGSANLFVDTTTSRVGVGTTEPTESLDIVGNLNLQKVSNTATIKLNSNVVTEFVRSKKLIKYPRVSMTAATTAGYTASASSENTGAARYAYNLFDNNRDTQWQMSATNNDSTQGYDLTSPYDANSYSPTITDNNGNDHTGAWVKLQLPGAIAISSMYIYAPTDNRRPDSAVLLGSNDNSTWYLIKDTFTVANRDENIISVPTSSYYTYVMFLVKSLTGNEGQLQISEIEFYGIPEYDPDADGTDVIVRSVPNVPNTDWLEVYYDGRDYTSMPATVTDKSGNGATGTPSGDVGFDTEYKAFTFDGVNDYISGTLPSSASGDWVHSISMWFKADSFSTAYDSNTLFYGGGASVSANNMTFLRVREDYIAYNDVGVAVEKDTSINTGVWYHVTGTYSGDGWSNAKLYINGILAATGAADTTPLTLTASSSFFVAKDINANNPSFNGQIANFRLFNRALTGDEVWQLYAYQKEYFGHGNLGMTLKSGRLGIGTSEPSAALDVHGTFQGNSSLRFFVLRGTFPSSGTTQDVTDLPQELVDRAGDIVFMQGITVSSNGDHVNWMRHASTTWEVDVMYDASVPKFLLSGFDASVTITSKGWRLFVVTT